MAMWIAAAAALTVAGRRAVVDDIGWDAIVVAGCRVQPDGTPSEALQRRAEAAAALWHAGVAPVVVTTGGRAPGRSVSEADAAATVLHRAGVPDAAIVRESASTSTVENAECTARDTGARRVVVVTDDYHVPRARAVFARRFEQVAGHGAHNPYVAPRARLREVVAVTWYALSGRL